MNRDEAWQAAIGYFERRGVGGTDGVAMIESATLEKPYGWIFHYNSRQYLESGELIHALVGQGPVVVIAATGEVVELGSACPSEVSVRQLELERKLV